MAAQDFTKVNVRKTTLARLQAEAARIMRAVEEGRRPDPGIDPEPINPDCAGLSLDQVLNLLLDRVVVQRKRDKKHREAKKRGAWRRWEVTFTFKTGEYVQEVRARSAEEAVAVFRTVQAGEDLDNCIIGCVCLMDDDQAVADPTDEHDYDEEMKTR